MILMRYFARHYALMLITMAVLLLSLVEFLELAELFRRASDKPQVTSGLVMVMGFLKLPETGQKLMPFIILFAAMAALWRLTRRNELVMARAAGLSIWQFTAPLVMVAFVFGMLNTTVLSPISAYMLGKYKRMEASYLQSSSTLELSGNGLWLRQPYEKGTLVIHAPHVMPDNRLELQKVLILFFDANENYRARWDAESGMLDNGRWLFRNVRQHSQNEQSVIEPELAVPTSLTVKRIEDSLAQPESLSFWDLPNYMKALEKTGFNPARYRQHYYSLMAQPLLFVGMVLLAAVFMQRQTRQGRALLAMVSAIGAGVVIFILNNMLLAFGITQAMPAPLAAVVVPLATVFLSTSALMHLEDA